MPEFKFERSFGPLSVYRVVDTDNHYTAPVKYEPVRYTGRDWKRSFYNWFKIPDIQDVPVVYAPNEKFKLEIDEAAKAPKVPLFAPKYQISEKIGNESIEFTTNLIGHPHIIRISYHPNWQVEGADKIYMVSPSFMLVYPKQNKVRLTFGKSKFNYIGEFITLLTILGVIYSYFYQKRSINNA